MIPVNQAKVNPMKKCINWHGLPCLLTRSDDTDVAVVFTNIDHEFMLCELSPEDLVAEETLQTMQQLGAFDCLGKGMDVQEEFTLVLCLTERCNAACRYCFLDAQTSGNTISEELLHRSIDYVSSHYPGREINIAAFGGEPSVAQGLVREMVRYSNAVLDQPHRFSITTNGYFDDAFCEFLCQNHFHISLSMDGTECVQTTQRPSSVPFAQLEKNIRQFTNCGCELKVRATVTEYSAPHMLDFVKYLSELKVKRIHFEPVTSGGRAETATPFTRPPTVEEFVSGLFSCIEYGLDHQIDVLSFPYMNMLIAPAVFCDGNIQNRLVVGATGVLSTCVEVQNPKHELFRALGVGSYDHSSCELCIEHKDRRPFYRAHSDLTRSKGCSECAFNFFCAGGCPVRNYRGTGATDTISDYRCAITKMVLPEILERYYIETFKTGEENCHEPAE